MSTTSTSPEGSERASPTPSSPSTSISSDGKPNNPPPWIIHHLLTSTIRWELPLRIMFSFNKGRNLPTLKDCHKWWHYEEQGLYLSKFFSGLEKIQDSTPKQPETQSSHDPNDRFMDHGNDALFDEVLKKYKTTITSAKRKDDEGKENPPGIPLGLVKLVCLDRTFRLKYEEANFEHALLAIDYLRDLEYTRRSKLRQAAKNLGITETDWREKLIDDPDALRWIEETEKAELEIELLYASLFIDLRVWTMLHLLKSDVFYKPNVLAMLNTLFPPGDQDLPNDRIIPKVMHQQRATFFQYAMAVEKAGNGRAVVVEFEKKMLMRENRHNYPAVRWRLEEYFSLAERMITKADLVYGIDFFRPKKADGLGERLGLSMSSLKQSSTLKSVRSMASVRSRFHPRTSQKINKLGTTSDEADEVASLYVPYDNTIIDDYENPPPQKFGEPEELRAVVERIRSFSRPTEFLRPNSEAALHAEFTKLRDTPSLPPPDLPVPSPSTAMFIPPPLKIQKMKKLEADDKKTQLIGISGKSKENLSNLQETKRKSSSVSIPPKTPDMLAKKSISGEIGESPSTSKNLGSTQKPKLIKGATFGSVEEFTPESKKSKPDLTKKPSMSSLKRTKRTNNSTTSSNESAANAITRRPSPELPAFNDLYDASPPRKKSTKNSGAENNANLSASLEQPLDDQMNSSGVEKQLNQGAADALVTSKRPPRDVTEPSPNSLSPEIAENSIALSAASNINSPSSQERLNEGSPKPRTGNSKPQAKIELDSSTSPIQIKNDENGNTTKPAMPELDLPLTGTSVFEVDKPKLQKRSFGSLRHQKKAPSSSSRKSEDEGTRPSTSDSSLKKFMSHRLPRKVSFSSPSKERPSLDSQRPSTAGSPFRKRPPPISTAQPAKPILKVHTGENSRIGGYLKNLGRNWTGHMVVQPGNPTTPPLLLTPNPHLPNDGGKFLEREWEPTDLAVEIIKKEGGKVRRTPSMRSLRGALRRAKSMTEIAHQTKPDSLGIDYDSDNVASSNSADKNAKSSQLKDEDAPPVPSTPEIKSKKLKKKASNVSLKSKGSAKFKISNPAPIDNIVLSLGNAQNLNDIKAPGSEIKAVSNEDEIPFAPPRPQTAPEMGEKSVNFGTWPVGVDEGRLESLPLKYRHNYAPKDLPRQKMKWAAWLEKEKNPPTPAQKLEGKFKGIIARPKLFKEWVKEEDTKQAKPLPPHVPRDTDNPVPRMGTYEYRDWEKEKWKDWEVIDGQSGEKVPLLMARNRDSGVVVHLPYETEEEAISLKVATPEQWDEIMANRKTRLMAWKQTNEEGRVVRLVQPEYSIFNPKDEEVRAKAEKELELEEMTIMNLPPQFRFDVRPASKKSKSKRKKRMVPPKTSKGQRKRLADVFPLSQSEADEFRSVNENDSMEVQIPLVFTLDNNYERIILPVDDWEDDEKEEKKKKSLKKMKSSADLKGNRNINSRNPFSRKASMVSLANTEASINNFKPNTSSNSVSTYTPARSNTYPFPPFSNSNNNNSFSTLGTPNASTSVATFRAVNENGSSTFQPPALRNASSFDSTPAGASFSSFNTTTPMSGLKSSPSFANLLASSRRPSGVSIATSKSRTASMGSNFLSYNKYTPKHSSTFSFRSLGMRKRDVRRSSGTMEKRLSDKAVFRGVVAKGPRRRRGVLFGRRESLIPEEIYVSTALSDRLRRKVLGEKERRESWKSKERARKAALKKAGRNTLFGGDESDDSSEDEIVEDW